MTASLFDLTELLIALKQAMLGISPERGQYIWTPRAHHFIAEVLREEPNPSLRSYEQRAIDDLFLERTELQAAAAEYDKWFSGTNRWQSGIAYHPKSTLLGRTSPTDPIAPWGNIDD
jgi:hypothetical protein